MNNKLKNQKIFPSTPDSINKSIEIISKGGVAILPADTVYGLFCRADLHESVERVYAIKQREKRKPFVIYTNKSKVADIVELSDVSRELIDKIWPKALSLVLKKKSNMPDWFAPNGTIAVMTAMNKVVSTVIANVPFPIIGTTVNISGEPEIKTAKEAEFFIDQVDIMIDDDSIPIYNKPSTMIDCTVNPPKIIRLSSLSLEEIQSVIPNTVIDLSGRIA